MLQIFDALTHSELNELLARLKAAEGKSLSAAASAPSEAETWPLIRVMADLRCLSEDVLVAARRAIVTTAGQ